MDEQQIDGTEGAPAPTDYDPPRVENVLNAGELAREIQYAGNGSLPP